MKIVVTGSLGSGKSTVIKFIRKKYPLFSADNTVKELYKKSFFRRLLTKKLKIKSSKISLKKVVKKMILNKKTNLKVIEKVIHPLVRKEMKKFSKINKNQSKLYYEIPLLFESKLSRLFDLIILVGAKKEIRLKRYLKKGGSKTNFLLLNKRQIKHALKAKLADHIVINNKSKKILKFRLSNIMKKYE